MTLCLLHAQPVLTLVSIFDSQIVHFNVFSFHTTPLVCFIFVIGVNSEG